MNGKHIFGRLPDLISSCVKKTLLFHHYLDYRRWEKEKQLSFLINIGLGIILGVAFFFILRLQFMEGLFNSTMDKLIKKEATAFMKITSAECRRPDDVECDRLRRKLSHDILFIDIDNDTYSGWGEPLFIPRNKIARFLKLADKNKAKVVALDILFDYPSNNPGEDAELRRCLENITKRKSSLKIIFPMSKSSINNNIKKNIFDELIDKNPNFYRAFPYASLSRSDRVVRYIRFYDIAKRNGRNVVLWGVPVLSVALFTNDVSKLRALEPEILDDFGHQRTEKYTIELSNNAMLEIANNELFSNRIRFALIPPGTFGSDGNLFSERILPDEIEALQQELRDKIVIIGTSSPEKEGWYRTPVGGMAGIYIIGNAMNVLLGNWQVRDAPPLVVYSVDLLVILFAGCMFVHCHPSVARTVAMIFASVMLVPVTYYFYAKYGIVINAMFLFINLVVPVMAMGWYKLHKNIKKLAITTIIKFISRY
jgi:CHASE2 domain-containing sensor protein